MSRLLPVKEDWPMAPNNCELFMGDLMGCMLLLLGAWFCSSCFRNMSVPVVGIPPTAPALGGRSELKSELWPKDMGCCGFGIRGPPGPPRLFSGGGEPDMEGMPGRMSESKQSA